MVNPPGMDAVRGIHRWPVDSPHKGPVTQKMFPFDGFLMWYLYDCQVLNYFTHTGQSYFASTVKLYIPSIHRCMGKMGSVGRISRRSIINWHDRKKSCDCARIKCRVTKRMIVSRIYIYIYIYIYMLTTGTTSWYHKVWYLGPLLLTWFNFNPSMDK